MIRSTRLLLQILLDVHPHRIDLKPVLRGVEVIFLSLFFLILSWLDVPHCVCISSHQLSSLLGLGLEAMIDEAAV
jgi:hypothetical protein